MTKKYSVKLNNLEKIEQLLQETYNLACEHYNQIQDEINKIKGTTTLQDLDIDGKEKYGKIMNNFLALQQKATAQKFDIAKLMAEVHKHNGNVSEAIDDLEKSKGLPNFKTLEDIKKMVQTTMTNSDDNNTDDTISYQLKK